MCLGLVVAWLWTWYYIPGTEALNQPYLDSFFHSVVKYIQKEQSENRKVLSFIESLVLKIVLYEASHLTYWQLSLPK